jgi:hypothetical protein
MSIKVVNKGYTLEVTSWENDGDNYKTKSLSFESKEEALAIRNMCLTLFKSSSNGEAGIGNSNEDESEMAEYTIIQYVSKNIDIIKFKDHEFDLENLENQIKLSFPEDTIREDYLDYIHDYLEDFNPEMREKWINIVMDYNNLLLGGSDYYYSRIVESCKLYFSPEDIILEEIE